MVNSMFHVNLVDFNRKFELLHLVLRCSCPSVSQLDLSAFSSSSCLPSWFFLFHRQSCIYLLSSSPLAWVLQLAAEPPDSFTTWALPVRAARTGFGSCPETRSWFTAQLAGPALCLSSFFRVRSGPWCSSPTW
jgi:hypothetical protein